MPSNLKISHLKIRTALICLLLVAPDAALCTPARAQTETEAGKLFVAYPKDGAKIWASSSFIVGNLTPPADLNVNDKPVKRNKDGNFAHVIRLKRGSNKFRITESASGKQLRLLTVVRPGPRAPLSAKQWKIIDKTMKPRTDLGVSIGELVLFKVNATPGGSMSARLGKRVVQLSSASDVREARKRRKKKAKAAGTRVKAQVNRGLAAAYGKVFQKLPARSKDLYVGFYKVEPTDTFNNTRLKFVLKRAGKTLGAESPARITVVRQPYLAQTTKDRTVVRVAPGGARLTPLPRGVRLMVDGWRGDSLRCLYGKRHVWIARDDMAFERGYPNRSGPLPRSMVHTINMARDNYGDAIVVPLNQRLPFEVEQSMQPNKLKLKIYGAIASTDWASQQYRKAFEQGTTDGEASEATDSTDSPVAGVSFKQADDEVYEIEVELRGNRQWGYFGAYHGSTLVLHVKRAPRFLTEDTGLSGLRICVDPGHGGSQPGAMGCSGISEAQVNLSIAKKLVKLLEQEGATVILTRKSDRTLGLYDRCDIAYNNASDILLSVHNNSLPNGRNPWKEHGSSTYFYHGQARELAEALDRALVRELKFPDIGARYQNLALTRPSFLLAVLVEIGFMIHPDEYSQLTTEAVQEKAARSLVSGLKEYLNRK